MIESIVFALVCDFGPSAARDLATSNEASAFAVGQLVDAQPPMVLVDNFVNFLGAEQSETTENKKAASDQLAAASRWAVFVRCRVLADVAGTVAIVAYGRACLGAAAILAAHAACWARRRRRACGPTRRAAAAVATARKDYWSGRRGARSTGHAWCVRADAARARLRLVVCGGLGGGRGGAAGCR